MPWAPWRRCHGWSGLILLALLVLNGCGGGGGGGGDSAKGGFTLDREQVRLSTRRGESAVPQTIRIQLTDDKAAYVGAGFREGVEPAHWLIAHIEGGGPVFKLILEAAAEPVGEYQTVLTIASADINGNILSTRDIQVRYSVKEQLDLGGADNISLGSFVYGASQAPLQQSLSVNAEGLRWTAGADVPWIRCDDQLHADSGFFTCMVEPEAAPVGEQIGTITVTDHDDPAETDQLRVHISVTPPLLTVASQILLGDVDGLKRDVESIPFSVNTGSHVYPWTLSFDPATAPAWLRPEQLSGNVSASGSQLVLGAQSEGLPGGSYSVLGRLDVNVAGIVLTQSIPITLNVAPERLYAQSAGIALSKLPSRSMLSRRIGILSSRARSGVAWSASSDAAWLSVSPSGVSGGELTVTANPASLQTNKTHFATVTLTSSDPAVATTETIRVGLWIGDQDPVELVPEIGNVQAVASPVEPLAYFFGHDAAEITAVNLYTGAVEQRFPLPRGATQLLISSDGRTLYANLDDVMQMLDTSSGALRGTLLPDDGSPVPSLMYGRPGGLPTIFMGDRKVFDAETGAALRPTPGSETLSDSLIGISGDGRNAYTVDYYLQRHTVDRSTLNGGFLRRAHAATSAQTVQQLNEPRVMVSPDNSRLYYHDQVMDALTMAPLGRLEGNRIDVLWDGRVLAASPRSGVVYPGTGPNDIYFYNPAGSLLTAQRCGPPGSSLRNLLPIWSGDGQRFICIADAGDGRPVHIKSTPP